eukprot:CAMPEP_0168567252 /NCGR_PEP_ID=MMETSP0413-20121227/14901_1 /TAXON_ID=136452 /ORGANISM="Filamoeba nolandi, Strain NC-AS-23-1" /LENGTH=503 /DNA_ID=CAMNT_0008599421 /DNA_START=207 /DNA_END=1718 /DNA_ORIENTATION=+
MTTQPRGENQSEVAPQPVDKTSATAEDDSADDPLSSACDYSSDDQENMRIKPSSEEKINQKKKQQFTVPDAHVNTSGSSSNSDTKAANNSNPQDAPEEDRECSPPGAENQEDGNSKTDSKNNKRHRASSSQKNLLENIFHTNQYPDLQLRTQLAMQLDMSPRKVQIWFQNRRTKAKHKNLKKPKTVAGVGSTPSEDVNQQNTSGETLLTIAATMGHSSVGYLLTKGANPNIANTKGQTPLLIAAKYCHEHVVEMLLQKQHNCNVNAREFEQGQSALHMCALKGYEKICLLLLSKGQNVIVNIRDYKNCTPLHHAAIYGHFNIAKHLLTCKADVDAQSNDGTTPLHAAALTNHPDVLKLLLLHGAEINFADNYGYNALTFAIREGHEECVRVLISNGAALNIKTHDGFAPLHIASCRPSSGIFKMLLERTGNPASCLTNKKQSPLHLAVMSGHLQHITVLLEKGCDILSKDADGFTPLDYARTLSDTRIVDSLKRGLFARSMPS